MKWYLIVLKKYAVFSGRASSKEFWMFQLFHIIFAIMAGILDYILGTTGLFFILYNLAVFIPALAVTVRRLHDVGASGWYLLLLLIPIFGVISLLILLAMGSNPGENKYGINPKENV